MANPLEHLSRDLDAVCSAWSKALGGDRGTADRPGRSDDASVMESMSDDGLVEMTDAVAQLARDAQALLARTAAEVARRSPVELGREGLAKKRGFLNPTHLVAASTGGKASEAAKLIAVGTDTAPRRALSGVELPPTNPHVAAALAAGAISVDAAGAITGMLRRVAPRADARAAEDMERVLAERAADLPFDLLLRVIREAEARLDHDGVAPREQELRADRSLTIRQDSTGMVRLIARLDPETAAPVKAAIEAIVTHGIRASRPGSSAASGSNSAAGADSGLATGVDSDLATGVGDGPDGAVIEDARSIPQMQADALAMIARHVIGCNRVPAAPATTMVVRVNLDTLTDGVGYGRIDGLNQPVSAGTLRRVAATAGIIPAVLGTDSVPLDLGRTARGFTAAQRIALGERDGGCACCGIAVGYTEAHHILWWKRDTGPTDLTNGVLLCPPCHARMHQDGWQIRVKNGHVWFTPPPQVDPTRTPRLGGRARFELPEEAPAA
jgi:5-methylcytosine-specific restriction protein A